MMYSILFGMAGGILSMLLVGAVVGEFALYMLLYSPIIYDLSTFTVLRSLVGGVTGLFVYVALRRASKPKRIIALAFTAGLLVTFLFAGFVTFAYAQ